MTEEEVVATAAGVVDVVDLTHEDNVFFEDTNKPTTPSHEHKPPPEYVEHPDDAKPRRPSSLLQQHVESSPSHRHASGSVTTTPGKEASLKEEEGRLLEKAADESRTKEETTSEAAAAGGNIFLPEPVKSSDEPPKPAQRRQMRPTSATRSLNNWSTSNSKQQLARSTSHFSLANPHLCSTNDFKYMGDQFKVGKVNPALVAPHEARFQKMWKSKMEKQLMTTAMTTTSSSFASPRKDIDVVKEYKRTKDERLLGHAFNLNDFKHTGNQFVVGKVNPNAQTLTEQRFQSAYRKRLEKLMPNWNEIKQLKPINFQDLKSIHNQLVVK